MGRRVVPRTEPTVPGRRCGDWRSQVSSRARARQPHSPSAAVISSLPRRAPRTTIRVADAPRVPRDVTVSLYIATAAPPTPAAREDLRRAPLVPVALAVTAGVLLDRSTPIPVAVSLLTVLAAAVGWAVSWKVRAAGVPLLFVAVGFVAAGAGWYRVRQLALPWDVGYYA